MNNSNMEIYKLLGVILSCTVLYAIGVEGQESTTTATNPLGFLGGDMEFDLGNLTECLSGNNVIMTSTGNKLVKDLEMHDEILTLDNDGVVRYEPMILDMHRMPHAEATFIHLVTDDGGEVIVTRKHYLYVKKPNSVYALTASELVRPGDTLYPDKPISKVSVIRERSGLYSPVVGGSGARMFLAAGSEGSRGALVSVYADDIPPLTARAAHQIMWGLRALHGLLPADVWRRLHHALGRHPRTGMPQWAHLLYTYTATL